MIRMGRALVDDGEEAVSIAHIHGLHLQTVLRSVGRLNYFTTHSYTANFIANYT